MEKTLPKVGDKLYLRQFTKETLMLIWIKYPYTVIGVTPSKVTVQECKLTAPVYHCVGNLNLDRPEFEGQRIFFYEHYCRKY